MKKAKGIEFDLIINGKPLTDKQKQAISDFIKMDKECLSNEGGLFINSLSLTQLTELTELASEASGHETETFADFKKATDRWRTQ